MNSKYRLLGWLSAVLVAALLLIGFGAASASAGTPDPTNTPTSDSVQLPPQSVVAFWLTTANGTQTPLKDADGVNWPQTLLGCSEDVVQKSFDKTTKKVVETTVCNKVNLADLPRCGGVIQFDTYWLNPFVKNHDKQTVFDLLASKTLTDQNADTKFADTDRKPGFTDGWKLVSLVDCSTPVSPVIVEPKCDTTTYTVTPGSFTLPVDTSDIKYTLGADGVTITATLQHSFTKGKPPVFHFWAKTLPAGWTVGTGKLADTATFVVTYDANPTCVSPSPTTTSPAPTSSTATDVVTASTINAGLASTGAAGGQLEALLIVVIALLAVGTPLGFLGVRRQRGNHNH